MLLTGCTLNNLFLNFILEGNLFCTGGHVNALPALWAAVMAFVNQLVQTVIAEPSQQRNKTKEHNKVFSLLLPQSAKGLPTVH